MRIDPNVASILCWFIVSFTVIAVAFIWREVRLREIEDLVEQEEEETQ